MAAVQDAYRFAWALEIKQSPTAIYAATTDLTSDAAVATMGHVYTRRVKHLDAVLQMALPDLFYGVDQAQAVTFVLDNADGAFDYSLEWRLVGVVLYHYDLATNTKVTDFSGIITQLDPVNSEVQLTIASQNVALFETLLPMTTIDADAAGPFPTTGAPGVAIPVVFGELVPVRPPSLAADIQSDPAGYDYAVGYDDLYVPVVYSDVEADSPGLERLGAWEQAPGSPTFIDSTHFSVTGDQSARYYVNCPIRFKTTASGATFLYTLVASYDAASTPDRVVLADPVCASGLNSIHLNGDFLIIRDGYDNVTAGLLIGGTANHPPAPGADITAIRIWAPEDGSLIALASNALWPTSTIHIADVIKEILTNTTWGLSALNAQTVNAGTFAAANVVLSLAGLTGAISGALGYDQQQRRAADVLNELLMMRGGRLSFDSAGAHSLFFDQQPAASAKNFALAPSDANAIKIKRVTHHGKQPVDQAVRNVVLHWAPLGRITSGTGSQKFTAREYWRTSTAACTSLGQDRHFFSQWIRSEAIAEKVVYYLAQKLLGADETLEFVTGVEARDVTLGEVVTVAIPSDGITASDWQVYGISKSLTEVSLACFRVNLAAYGAPSGVVHSAVPTDTEVRTEPVIGGNLIGNPDFSPPAAIVGQGYPHGWSLVPRTGWGFGMSLPAWTITVHMDYSVSTLPRTYGGHYLRTIFASVPAVPALAGNMPPGLYTEPIAVNSAVHESVFASVYCDQADGVWIAIGEIPTFGSATSKMLPVVYDSTDMNAMGWGRYYARGRLATNTMQVVVLFGVNKSATFQWDAADFRVIARSGRKPPRWSRAKPTVVTLTKVAEIDFALGNTASNLIPAGAYVRGVTLRVTATITYGTATSYDIGTAINGEAWGSAINRTAVDQTTDSRDFTVGNATFFATATSVIVAGHTAGTITSGKVCVQVEYSFAGPSSGL